MPNKLYLEFRVYFPDDSNQDTLLEMGEQIKDMLYDETGSDTGIEIPSTDVTYELKMEKE